MKVSMIYMAYVTEAGEYTVEADLESVMGPTN
jgi:hypothetical protein